MDATTGQDRQALLEELARAREKLDALVGDLRELDVELDDLAPEREQHRLLQSACAALEELAKIGGAKLFWDGTASGSGGEDHVRRARSRIDVFEKRVLELEQRREAIRVAIAHQQGDAYGLEYDVLEAEDEEERRQSEWIVEREIGPLPSRAAIMPWTRGGEDDRRFHKSLSSSLLLSLLLTLLIPLVELPLPEPWKPLEVPERLTRLIPERPLPPRATADATRPREHKPKPLEKPLVAEKAATPTPGPQAAPETAPGASGILAFKEKFAELADDEPVARLGSKARISSTGDAASRTPERSLITTQAPGSSGGINLASLSRGLGKGSGQELAGVQIARETSSIAVASGGSGGAASAGVGKGAPPLGRTDEEIQIVFDRHKAALYRLYNLELRNDPTLMGQVVLRIRIEPDGRVTLCELQTTDMKAPQLVAEVIARVRTFDFGAKDNIPAITILYPIDFLPAT